MTENGGNMSNKNKEDITNTNDINIKLKYENPTIKKSNSVPISNENQMCFSDDDFPVFCDSEKTAEKFESQWEYSTQLEHFVENADALVSLINTKELSQPSSGEVIIIESDDSLDKTETIILNSQNSVSDKDIQILSNKHNQLNKDIHLSVESSKSTENVLINMDKNIDSFEKNTEIFNKENKDVLIDKNENISENIEFLTCPDSPIIHTQSSRKSYISISSQNDKPLKKKRKKSEDQLESISTQDEHTNAKSLGIPISNNKKVKLSIDTIGDNQTKVLKECVNVMTNSDDVDELPNSCEEEIPCSQAFSTNKYLLVSKNVESGNSQPTLIGFMTASNKKVDISEIALQKVKRLFNNIEEEINIDNILNETENDKKVGIFENTTKKTKQPFDEREFKIPEKLTPKNTFPSFTTANNKKIVVSDKAMKNAMNLFDSVDKENINTNEKFDGFMTASNKEVKISKDAVEKVKHIFEDINEDKTVNIKNISNTLDNSKRTFDGFSTASNKKVYVSEDALKKAKRLFDNDEDERKKSFDTPINRSENIKFDGFKTASNKKVNISDDALKKVKNLFDNIEEHKDINIVSEHEKFGGFKTASNKKVDVSADALKKVKHLFDNIEEEKGVNTEFKSPESDSKFDKSSFKNIEFEGFKTAGNKKIDVSEDALKKVQHIFDNIEGEKEISAKSKFSELDNKSSNENFIDNNIKFDGFKTASNKKVDVSKDTIKKVKHLFDNIEEGNTTENEIKPAFSGFITANNKKVQICEESFKKVKHLFDETENEYSFNNKKQKLEDTSSLKRNDNILNDDEDIFDEFDNEIFTQNTKNNVKFDKNEDFEQCLENEFNSNFFSSNRYKENIDEAVQNLKIPTLKSLSIKAIMNDTIGLSEGDKKLEVKSESVENLNLNDDILDSPSSPIIRVRKRFQKKNKKNIFQTPYKKNINPDCDINTLKSIKISKSDNINDFEDFDRDVCLGDLLNEKITRNKNIVYLKNLCKMSDFLNIEREILELTPQNYADFKFKNSRIDVDFKKSEYSIEDLIAIFINHKDVNKELIPEGWVKNHMKWIMWKLASYERNYEVYYKILTVSNVLKQLKYRYDRELYKTERPILRKVLEKDEVPSKRMILCVSNIILMNTEKNDRNDKVKYELEVTDGWYDVGVVIDPILSTMIDRGKIKVGTKLIMFGAELLNCQQGVAPLEDKGAVRLKIWGNNCRRAASWTKLGLYKYPNKPLPMKLSSYKAGRGPIPSLKLIPLNIYPLMYLNKLPDGSVVMRSERVQQIHNVKNEADLQNRMEQIYLTVEKEFANKEAKNKKLNSGKMVKNSHLSESPEKLIAAYESVADPSEFLNSLSRNQRDILQRYNLEKNVKMRREIDDRVRELINEQGLANQQAVKVLKARVISYEDADYTTAILTIWKLDEAIVDMFKVGTCLNVTNLTLTCIRSGEIHLSAGKRSTFYEVPIDKTSSKYDPIDGYMNRFHTFSNVYSESFTPHFNEVNLVGIVIDIIPRIEEGDKNNGMQTMYLADEYESLIAVNFWGGINKYGFGKIVENNICLACMNLQHRPRSITKRIRQLYVTDTTVITHRPKQKYMQNALDDLADKTKGDNEYLNRCKEKLNDILKALRENVKKQSVKCKIVQDEHSLSGLDFDSTFVDGSQAGVSNDFINLSDSKAHLSSMIRENSVTFNESVVEKRINKLKMYGEPPPLSPIVLSSSKRLNKTFVSPCINLSNKNDISTKDSESKDYKKRIINFTEDDCEDVSPPLSLE